MRHVAYEDVEQDDASRTYSRCVKLMKPVQTALSVLSGKWKIPIIISLLYSSKRYKEIVEDISNITDRMLSKELRELETNGLVRRVVHDTRPVKIEYSMTEYGRTLEPIILALAAWGENHQNVE